MELCLEIWGLLTEKVQKEGKADARDSFSKGDSPQKSNRSPQKSNRSNVVTKTKDTIDSLEGYDVEFTKEVMPSVDTATQIKTSDLQEIRKIEEARSLERAKAKNGCQVQL